MGEENIKQAGNAYLILRTSWVYGLRGNSFVNKVLGWARKNSTLRIVDDQVSSPTWARMLAQITSLLLAQNQGNLYQNIHEQCGIYHLAGSGYTSRYEWANRSSPTIHTARTKRFKPSNQRALQNSQRQPLARSFQRWTAPVLKKHLDCDYLHGIVP